MSTDDIDITAGVTSKLKNRKSPGVDNTYPMNYQNKEDLK